ncbi:MAG: YqaJ viral recombinase family protein [Patescibacteria group bacterium]
MSAKTIATRHQVDGQAWLDLLKQGILGTDAPAICGLHPRLTPVDVWLAKTGHKTPIPETVPALLRDPVAKAFMAQAGVLVRRRLVLLQDDEFGFLLSNLEYTTYEPADGIGILELETGGPLNLLREWEQAGGPPEWFRLQAVHDMAVTGYSYAHLAALVPAEHGLEIRHARMERDEEAINSLVEIERDFWQDHVKACIPPTGDTRAMTALLSALYPAVHSPEIELPESAREFLVGYERADRVVREAEARREHYANLLKGILMDSSAATLGEYRVIWDSPTPGGERRFRVEKRDWRS